MRARRLVAPVLFVAPLVAGAALLAEDGWIEVKARVAAVRIERAFAAHLEDGGRHRPWSWADTWPVAELEVPRLAIRRFVLAGSSGSSLAFGPGHVDGTAGPNEIGNCVLAGHRDTWFAFLESLKPADEVLLRTHGSAVKYRVERVEVRHDRDGSSLRPSSNRRLTLVTCYPFGGIRRSSLRYVVICRPVERPSGGGPEDRAGARISV